MTNKKCSTDRFGYEWDKYNKIIPEYEIQFLKWVYPMNKKDFRDKLVLDAGCGTGRNSYWVLKYRSKGITAFDYDARTVDVAKRNLSGFKNATVLFKSIYDIEYKEQFDIAMSIGVIHHLENPKKAIEKLTESVKSKGKVIIWVYGYEGNEWIVRYVNPVRKFTSRMPESIINVLSYSLSIPLYLYVKLFKPKRKYLQHISKFKLWHIHSIVFDQLIPRIANYWKKEEILSLFDSSKFEKIDIYQVNDMSYTVIGIKK